jgi:hypothetical protein
MIPIKFDFIKFKISSLQVLTKEDPKMVRQDTGVRKLARHTYPS